MLLMLAACAPQAERRVEVVPPPEGIVVEPHGARMALAGTVTRIVEQAENPGFVLDYGRGDILVETGHWDIEQPKPDIHVGDRVTVYGLVDDEAFEREALLASTIYVNRTRTYFYADDGAAFGDYSYPLSAYADAGDWVNVVGRVEAVDGYTMIIDTGLNDLRIDTSTMTYSPFAGTPYPVTEGMRVSVHGAVEHPGLFERPEINATSVMVLTDSQRLGLADEAAHRAAAPPMPLLPGDRR